MPTINEPCRCGSGELYDDCCGPLHRRERTATTAVALMRSRFCAFAVGDTDYLLATWDRRHRPATLSLDEDTTWRRLQIVDTEAGTENDVTGMVQFRAQYQRDGSRHILHERSRFVRDNRGDWVYLDGVFVE
ncbi:SEC-C motif-containing protein [Mycobacterium sp. MAA66]|uniref:YchJ family protein n=1 Tax=Mycobacterium sp. MAA66 TaxID=3156297 RepID=UPI00351818F8